MKRVSLDTPNDVLWSDPNPIERVMQERPAPVNNTRVLTSNGNLIQPKAR